MKKTIPPFLTAEWRRLINLTYPVSPDLLLPYLPKGTEPDIYQGKAHVSLVAFEFLHTRLKGIPIPFHINFPEVNLRYYLRYKGQLGVAFVKELVPRFCIAYIARTLYNEPYEALKMKVEVKKEALQQVHHTMYRRREKYSITVNSGLEQMDAPLNSPTHYFKEHDLGFGEDHKGRGLFYHVSHPIWKVYEVRSHHLDFDFGKMYGEQWSFLNDAEPLYKVLAEGSKIGVSNPRLLRDFGDYQHLFKGPENL